MKPSPLIGALTYLLFPASFLFSFPYPLILFSMFIWGWGAAVFWTAGTVAILNLSREGRFGSYSEMLYTSLQTGFALGVALLGYLFNRWGEIPIIPLPSPPPSWGAFSSSSPSSSLYEG